MFSAFTLFVPVSEVRLILALSYTRSSLLPVDSGAPLEELFGQEYKCVHEEVCTVICMRYEGSVMYPVYKVCTIIIFNIGENQHSHHWNRGERERAPLL